MLDDSSRIVEDSVDPDDPNPDDKGGAVIKRELKTKEDIKNYVKGII